MHLINSLNTLILYSLPTSSFLVSKDEEKENEEIPDKIFCVLGHLSRQSCKQRSRRLSRRWQSLTKTDTRCYRCFTWASCFNTHFDRSNPPPSLKYTTWKPCLPWNLKSRQ